ncbi:hypothetical protein HOP38_14150 [Vibrio mediterranei]|uniref:hypothetical protein n=1 Tax=Vibrio TaxID=662 RepID=UPI0017EFD3F8|nr:MULTISPECIES: hypothetical protein [Vibrio]NUW73660.1 hypothetical protein [Vibrio mediterranei]USE00165.1 hypothetical protein JKJ11_14610 [Vibrio sp. SCSIO 43133]
MKLSINAFLMVFIVIGLLSTIYISVSNYVDYKEKQDLQLLENQRIEAIASQSSKKRQVLTYLNLLNAKDAALYFHTIVNIGIFNEISNWRIKSVDYGIDSGSPPKISVIYQNVNGSQVFFIEHIVNQIVGLGLMKKEDTVNFSDSNKIATLMLEPIPSEPIPIMNFEHIKVKETHSISDMANLINNYTELYRNMDNNIKVTLATTQNEIYISEDMNIYKINLSYEGDIYSLYSLIDIFPESSNVFFEKLSFKDSKYIADIGVIYNG